jgi:hypothetical protein
MRHSIFIVFLLSAALLGCSRHAETQPNSSSIQWPPLTNFPFISGRAATTNDIALNHALFVQESNGQAIGKPLNIKIPQYAFYIDEQTHQRTPCVIVQAEESEEAGQEIGALTVPDGHGLVGLYQEFVFLGDTPPKSQ